MGILARRLFYGTVLSTLYFLATIALGAWPGACACGTTVAWRGVLAVSILGASVGVTLSLLAAQPSARGPTPAGRATLIVAMVTAALLAGLGVGDDMALLHLEGLPNILSLFVLRFAIATPLCLVAGRLWLKAVSWTLDAGRR